MAFALRSSTLSGVQARRPATAVRRVAPISRRVVTVRAAGSPYPSNWLNKEPLALVLGFLGWTVPSNIPVSAFGDKSLFGLLTGSIAENLAKFPQGPSLDDPFWLYLLTWHIGLFLTLTLGQIGINGRKQGYW